MLLATLREAASDAHDPTTSNVMNSSYSTGFAPPRQALYPTKVKKSHCDKEPLVESSPNQRLFAL